jgi:RNA polymerase sigma-70 factor (sigma-E family)
MTFDEYVQDRMRWLRKIAFTMCDDRHRAEDVVQESITKLYRHWGRVARMDNVDAYVRTIIVRTVISERRTGWARHVELRELPDRPVEPTIDPATRQVVREALSQLAPRQRETLELRFYRDLSVEQTAAALDCSAGNVKSQTSRGLQSLRRVLEHQRLLSA